MTWLTDIRRIALLGCIFAALNAVFLVWNLTPALGTVFRVDASLRPVLPQLESALVVAFGFFAMLLNLAFLWALYRNEGDLQSTVNLRRLALYAAIAYAAALAADVPAWTRSLAYFGKIDWRVGGSSVAMALGGLRGIRVLSYACGEIGNIANVLLLVAFFRLPDSAPAARPMSGLLSRLAGAAFLVAGLSFAYALYRLLLAPYAYFQARDYLETLRDPPSMAALLTGPVKAFLMSGGLCVATYIVYWNKRASSETASSEGITQVE